MWERPNTGEGELDPFVIHMTVTAIELPERTEPLSRVRTRDGARAEAVTMLPRQGTGTWPNGERAVRLGNAEEILITLASNPFAAMDAARDDAVFDPMPRNLRIVTASRRDGDFELSWSGALRAPLRWRPVNLRLYASPSLNVTVMTIVPVRARKISSRWFVRQGLASARLLASRIDAALTQRSDFSSS